MGGLKRWKAQPFSGLQGLGHYFRANDLCLWDDMAMAEFQGTRPEKEGLYGYF
jgi:hypothetical protein